MTADIHALTGVYALDALPDDELAEFEAHLAVCSTCADDVASLRAAAAHLADLAPVEPPADLRAAVMDAIDTTRQEPPYVARREVTGHKPWTSRLGLGLAAGLLLVVGALGLWVNNLSQQLRFQDQQTQAVTAVLAADDAVTHHANGSALVVSPSGGQALFATTDLAPPSQDRVLQLWVIDESGPKSAGLVTDPSRPTLLDLPVRPGVTVGVTVEPLGGSPAPTSDPVAAFEI